MPIQWRGGPIISLYKGKGDAADCNSSRGVCIESGLAKKHSGYVRAQFACTFNRAVRESQCGGVAKRGTDFASHRVRTLIEYSRTKRKPMALLFLDVVGAFDSLLREIVLTLLESMEIVLDFLKNLSPDADTYDRLRNLVNGKSILSKIGTTKHLETMISTLHHCTWFSTPNAASVIATKRGSRPGNALGDVLFNVLVTHVLEFVEQQLADDDLLSQQLMPVDNHVTRAFKESNGLDVTDTRLTMHDVSYCDDCVVPVFAETCPLLIKKLSKVLEVVHYSFRVHGLELNFKAGKTETLLSLVGSGSKEAKRALYDAGACILFRPRCSNRQISVHVCNSYKHMGSIVHMSASNSQEIVNRSSQCSNACGRLRTKVFKCAKLSCTVKLSLVHSLLLSRLFYNSQLWCWLNAKDERRLHHAYVNCFRAALGMFNREDSVDRTSDEEILKLAGVPHSSVIVRLSRLRYYRRLIISDQHQLLRYLCAVSVRAGTWLAQIQNDMAWMAASLPSKLSELPSPFIDLQPWNELVTNSGWSHLLDAVAEASAAAHIVQSLCAPPDCDASFFCYECGRSFESIQLLHNHAHRSHGYVSTARLYAPDLQCKSCLTVFSNRDRVVQHLNSHRTNDCLHLLQNVYLPLSHDAVRKLDKQALACSKTCISGRPAYRCAGPLLHADMFDGTRPFTVN